MHKLLVCAMAVLVLSGCEYGSQDSDMTGQVKSIDHVVPLICPDYAKVDIHVGVVGNVYAYASNPNDIKLLKQSEDSGKSVQVTYTVARTALCVPPRTRLITKVQLLKV